MKQLSQFQEMKRFSFTKVLIGKNRAMKEVEEQQHKHSSILCYDHVYQMHDLPCETSEREQESLYYEYESQLEVEQIHLANELIKQFGSLFGPEHYELIINHSGFIDLFMQELNIKHNQI